MSIAIALIGWLVVQSVSRRSADPGTADQATADQGTADQGTTGPAATAAAGLASLPAALPSAMSPGTKGSSVPGVAIRDYGVAAGQLPGSKVARIYTQGPDTSGYRSGPWAGDGRGGKSPTTGKDVADKDELLDAYDRIGSAVKGFSGVQAEEH